MASPFEITQGAENTDEFVKLFIFGRPGVGKTVLSATCVDEESMKDVFFINAEAGTKSIQASGAVKNHENITFATIRNFKQFIAAEKFLRAYLTACNSGDGATLKKMKEKFPDLDTTKRYKTLIIDSISEITDMKLAEILGVNPNDLNADTIKPGYDEWGRLKNTMNRVIRSFRDLPMNVIILGLAVEKTDDGRLLGIIPKIAGSFKEDILALVDTVGYLEKKEIKVDTGGDEMEKQIVRRLLLQNTGKIDAKCRLVPDDVKYLQDPTIPKLMELMEDN